MRVRVKEGSKVLSVTAFGGQQYTRAEWRDVPAGSEEEARRHPYLEVESTKAVEPEALKADVTISETPKAEKAIPPAPKEKGKSKAKDKPAPKEKAIPESPEAEAGEPQPAEGG